jgi:hypothetical protein
MGDQVILPAAYAAERWTDFGVGVAGASAALAGLVFVAVSINLSEILKYRNLPGRAALTLFVTPLIVGFLLLVPGQPGAALGTELLVAGIWLGGFELVLNQRSGRSEKETRAVVGPGPVLAADRELRQPGPGRGDVAGPGRGRTVLAGAQRAGGVCLRPDQRLGAAGGDPALRLAPRPVPASD